jgi:hypothetical protein
VGELFVCDLEVASKIAKLRTDIGEPPFQRRPGHGGEV